MLWLVCVEDGRPLLQGMNLGDSEVSPLKRRVTDTRAPFLAPHQSHHYLCPSGIAGKCSLDFISQQMQA